MNRKLVLGAVALLAAGAAALFATGTLSLPFAGHGKAAAKKSAQAAVAPQPVSVTRAVMADFKQTVLLTGTLVPREEILVSPELSGYRIKKLHAEAGDEVEKGEVLAELVADQLNARMAQNKAALAKADAAIAQAKSQIAEADAALDQSRADFKRARFLKRKGHVSGAVYDQRRAAQRTASARLASARDGLTLAKAEKAQVKAQRKELDWQLGNTKVRSPAGGIISRRTARLGAMASASAAPLFRIIENGEIELDAEVPEAALQKLKVGQIARVTVPGLAPVTGRLRLISPEVDKASRLGRARLFLGVNPALHIGSFGRAVIETASGRGLAVPLSSVLYDAAKPFLQVVTDNRIVRRDVTTGLRTNGQVEITSGVAEGELIVTRAGTFLRSGDLVRPLIDGGAKPGDAARLSEAL